jgi:signal transduction histidine kinase/HAMP domain-containing protein
MKRPSFKRIKTRFTFWFLIIALIPLIFGMLIGFYQEKQEIEKGTFSKLISIRNLKVQQLEQWLYERKGDIHIIAEDIEIRSLEAILEKKSKLTDDIEKIKIAEIVMNRFMNHYEDYEDYEEIFIIGINSGLVEISTNPEMLGKNKSNDLYYTVPIETGEMYIKDIYSSESMGKPQMTISLPIYCLSHNTHVIGILVVSINLEKSLFKLLLNRVGLGKTGETLIVNKDVIALNELRWRDNAPLNLKISAEAAVSGAQGKTGIVITTDYRGEDILAAYTYIPETGWGFVCKQDIDELNAPILEMIRNYIVLFIITITIVLIIIYFVSKSIAKPIVNLNLVANQIQAGNLSVRNKVFPQNELGSLALAFNNMADAVESKMKIQKEVSEIFEIVIKQSSLKEFSSKLLKKMMKSVGANMSVFYLLNDNTSEYEHFISFGASEELLISFKTENPDAEFEKTLSEKSIYCIEDISEDTILKYKPESGDSTPKEIITIPIIVEGSVIALISLVNINKFNKFSYEVLTQSLNAINISYSSLLSNERTRIFAESLARINQQLETQSEKLEDQTTALNKQAEELNLTSEKLQVQNTALETKNEKISESQQAMTYLMEDMNESSEQLRIANEQLKKANNEMEAFSYSVSHDLRAPLRAIDGFTRILMEDYIVDLDAEGKRLGSVIQNNAKKMGQLIDDLLAFSRLGRSEFQNSFIDMDHMVNSIYYQVTDEEQKKHIDMSIDNLGSAYGDLAMIKQVWINLISNAIKFSSKKKKSVIRITCKKKNVEKFVYCISDNGAGFDMRYIDKLFGVFQRLHSPKEFEGTGVGLANVQRIITRHGGEVWAESEVDQGAKFYFSLPIIN